MVVTPPWGSPPLRRWRPGRRLGDAAAAAAIRSAVASRCSGNGCGLRQCLGAATRRRLVAPRSNCGAADTGLRATVSIADMACGCFLASDDMASEL
ncbi:hypothetical protein E2562_016069 [Oryza meyeriana var. granulata]|uniref:Uncharacterized protein n=1 Tax=Oryza meyeriana var. granulata TaxID=110450 RepID=A0A6G1BL59_9ORYZ|nr:hypothetical protein E2562_016069 [Oryza meyeriana var. granulata]